MKQVFALVRISAMALLTVGIIACSSDKKEAASGPDKGAESTKPADEPKAGDTKTAKVAGDAEGAKALYEARCVACHGATGKGDGPGAAALEPKPRAYNDPEWQASVSDEEIATVIVKGGLAVGKAAIMPANPDLKDKPEIVQGLVDIIRDFEE